MRYKVNLKHETNLLNALNWAGANCKYTYHFTHRSKKRGTEIYFHFMFEDKNDAVIFALRWA